MDHPLKRKWPVTRTWVTRESGHLDLTLTADIGGIIVEAKQSVLVDSPLPMSIRVIERQLQGQILQEISERLFGK